MKPPVCEAAKVISRTVEPQRRMRRWRVLGVERIYLTQERDQRLKYQVP
jgi:hypothetical protein